MGRISSLSPQTGSCMFLREASMTGSIYVSDPDPIWVQSRGHWTDERSSLNATTCYGIGWPARRPTPPLLQAYRGQIMKIKQQLLLKVHWRPWFTRCTSALWSQASFVGISSLPIYIASPLKTPTMFNYAPNAHSHRGSPTSGGCWRGRTLMPPSSGRQWYPPGSCLSTNLWGWGGGHADLKS